MSTNCFVPLHEAHAIEQVVAQLTFSKELPEAEFRLERWQQHAEKVSELLPAFAPEAGIRVEQIPNMLPRVRTGLMAFTFTRVQPNGAPAIQLRVERDGIAFATLTYSRWAGFYEQAIELFEPLIADRFAAGHQIVSASLTYTDRFLWRGDQNKMDASLLFRWPCRWATRNIFETREDWHSHSGEFRRISEGTRRLVNVNLDTGRVDAGAMNRGRNIGVTLALTDSINQPGYEQTKHSGAESYPWVRDTLEKLHVCNKNLMSEILTDEMLAKISLTGAGNVSA